MLPPTIPTSFVPHAAPASRRFRADFGGVFSFLSYAALALALALAIGVFFYGRVLAASQSSKDAALARAEAAIDPTTVEDFVRLRDRLSSGQKLLANHAAFSGFFASFSALLPPTVRFTSLHLFVDGKGALRFEGTGIAKNFNALANASAAFARDGRIEDAIFSNIVVTKEGTVSFALAAALDPKIVAFSP